VLLVLFPFFVSSVAHSNLRSSETVLAVTETEGSLNHGGSCATSPCSGRSSRPSPSLTISSYPTPANSHLQMNRLIELLSSSGIARQDPSRTGHSTTSQFDLKYHPQFPFDLNFRGRSNYQDYETARPQAGCERWKSFVASEKFFPCPAMVIPFEG
jgi:hypothetical protein